MQFSVADFFNPFANLYLFLDLSPPYVKVLLGNELTQKLQIKLK